LSGDQVWGLGVTDSLLEKFAPKTSFKKTYLRREPPKKSNKTTNFFEQLA
jgi:hypothetical protein